MDGSKRIVKGIRGTLLHHEGQQIMGSQKLTSLPFQQCHHSITTVDCQPSGANGGMLVFVSGNLQLAGEQHGQQIMFLFLLNLLLMNPFSREELKMMMMVVMIIAFTRF